MNQTIGAWLHDFCVDGGVSEEQEYSLAEAKIIAHKFKEWMDLQ